MMKYYSASDKINANVTEMRVNLADARWQKTVIETTQLALNQ